MSVVFVELKNDLGSKEKVASTAFCQLSEILKPADQFPFHQSKLV
jgi:hypothetical protein